MDEAIEEITQLVTEKFPEGVTRIEINISPFESGDGVDVVPGSFNVFVEFDNVGITQEAERQWDPDQGFHFILKDPQPEFMASTDSEPWDEERKLKENQKIDEGEQGLDSVVLELKSDVKNEGQPTNYRVNVQVGEDPKNQVYLQVDTGSSILWAQSRVQRRQTVPPGRSFLDVTVMGMERFQKGSNFYQITYGNDKKVRFALFQSTVKIGELKTTQVFGAAEISPQENTLPVGILGLGFQRENSPVPFHRTLVVQLKETGMIKRASFALVGPRAEPAGTIKPNTDKTRDRGWLIIGAIRDEYHNGITWCPVLVEKYRSWVVQLNKVTVNGVVICENQLALIDTGSSYLTTSRTHSEKIAEVIGGKLNKGSVTYASGALKDFSFTFGNPDGEATFGLNAEDLSLGPVPSGTDDEVRSPLTFLKSFDNDSKTDYWILGGIFIDNMITVFDYSGEQRIGFASRSNVDPVIGNGVL